MRTVIVLLVALSCALPAVAGGPTPAQRADELHRQVEALNAAVLAAKPHLDVDLGCMIPSLQRQQIMLVTRIPYRPPNLPKAPSRHELYEATRSVGSSK